MNQVYEHDDTSGRTDHTMTVRLRRALRRIDDWTLYAFNPRVPR